MKHSSIAAGTGVLCQGAVPCEYLVGSATKTWRPALVHCTGCWAAGNWRSSVGALHKHRFRPDGRPACWVESHCHTMWLQEWLTQHMLAGEHATHVWQAER